jgi:hypothetical protein
MDPRFPNHKPEDADLSKVKGYTGHPGQERVNADLTSQHENSAMRQLEDKNQPEDVKVGGEDDQSQQRRERREKHRQEQDKESVLEAALQEKEPEDDSHKNKKHK